MFNKMRLKAALVEYKKRFVQIQWPDEKYKWEAVKCFQVNWNVNADDFAAMLTKALSQTSNLLASVNNFPAKMITKFGEVAQEEVRGMFIELFDEDKDVYERIDAFKQKSNSLLERYGNGAAQHYQYENAISTYLWLRYPDKYYIYKLMEVKAVSNELESSYTFKKGAYADNIRNFLAFYNEICDELKQDDELKNMLASQITGTCYPDPELRTLTMDVGFFISRYLNKDETDSSSGEWWPTDYTPALSADDWEALLNDAEIFTDSSLEIMKRMLDYGGQATCTQLAIKYGESKNFYNGGSSALARRVVNKTGCPILLRDNDNSKWWPVLYVGKAAKKDEEGIYVWKLRNELEEALGRVDLSKVNLYANLKPNFWKISHGNDCISEAEAEAFEKRQVIVVHRDTAAKGKSKVSQGEDFMATMKKGDFFYLCRGNSIRLLGRIDSDEVNENPEKQDGWCERSYTVIAKSRDTSAYTGDKKWWTPNDNSTCIIVPISETQLFEDYILKPYFDITKEDLLKNDTSGLHYWFLNANPKIWSMSSMPIGEVQDYTLYNDNGNKRRIFQNFLDAKAGDMVIGYESTPVKQIVAILRVSAEQDGQKIYFEKVEGLSSPIDFSMLKECPELEKMEYFSMTQGSLFKLTRGEYDFIIDMIREENLTPSDNGNAKYTKADFLRDVYMTEAKYDRLKAVLEKKKNIILQGAPGVGKTFAAKRLAYSVMGEVDDDRIEFVQFHQNYSYEDFMMGYKPVGEGFELKYGIFYRFCQKAANHPDKDYFFIIDEINRGNMSKIFGELLMLIEADYRDKKVTLAYNGLSFSVPKRVHIIGMMNTADRSLAMIDYALRRRFSFFDMEPGFDSDGFINYQNSFANDTFNTLIERIKELNREIAADKSLGKGFCIGHSYFCNADDSIEEWMKDVVDFDILPMLSEYWFDDSSKLQRWENILHGVFQ
ncbi:AAA family ATPase [Anthropogastromicrobium sp.]|uniref:AAA family ATPase n=1 Tax=Anthropogastromicrobium sp. TaxID=2981649 RepID=UPI00307AEE71